MASSSSSSPSVPTISPRSWTNHVFLSFRGEDTREKFVGHLYTALENMGIHTFKDDKKLSLGESINPSLIKAIKESQITIVVFSENYANSSWCLNELVCIMECKKETGLIVVPIFYDVEPSEVRKQKRKYEEAFARYESEANANIVSWKKALVEACEVSGPDFNNKANMDESELIKDIVNKISKMIRPLTQRVNDNLIGLEDRMRDLTSKLQIGSDDVRMIGIWGVGGGGKTTLASSVYREISWEFDGCCLAENIREQSSKNGLKKVQEEILSGVLKLDRVQVGSVVEGEDMIMDRLCRKKVLIVLDDVDHLDQLKALAGSHDWFGKGSRIIITTRNQHLLTAHKVNVIHNISLLNNDEAMKLLCKHAPRGDKRIEDYEVLSMEVVSYAGGLPLALRVLGHFLCDKDMNEWRCALARLKEIPDNQILEKLKISFDGLMPLERELFLDIACFFRGHSKDESMSILDACGFHPGIGIKVLEQKALITISEDGEFDMHDLVEEMAHYIVRGEPPQNPEKHSRVWKKEDFQKICAMDAMTNLDRIEAINVPWWFKSDEARVLEVAANMKKLRWIGLDSELGETTLPEKFPPGELRCLTLSWIGAKQLWEGNKVLPNLRMIKLDRMKKLMKTPDFKGLPNLERFMVSDAPLLEEIHPSFGRLEKLLYVHIELCDNLKIVPPFTWSKELETLVLPGCKLVFNHSTIQQNVENFLPHYTNHIGQWFFSGCLRKLDLSSCNLADGDITSSAVWELPNLQELDLSENRFVRLNFSQMRLPRLKWLDVSYCEDLVQLPELPSSIAIVIADGCSSLESFGDISNCKGLWKVSVWRDNKLGPRDGDILLDSMLQGNAKDYFISISLAGIDIWRGSPILWVDWVKTYNMQLPDDWYNAFSGILMFVKCKDSYYMGFDIVIKHGVDEDFQSEIHQESNETVNDDYDETYVGYVSFSSLRHTGCLNSAYNIISFSLYNEHVYKDGYKIRAVLYPKDDPMQTTKIATDSSEFWDEKEVYERKTFTIQCESNSSIKIIWKVLSHYEV